ncbi:MAG TPA: hypothetical protein VM262_14340 [Acidimicrobiales bacterium]|jgi:hypothetical protein|nr:hypothetical protein [Acidimicrobiales bacterium]
MEPVSDPRLAGAKPAHRLAVGIGIHTLADRLAGLDADGVRRFANRLLAGELVAQHVMSRAFAESINDDHMSPEDVLATLHASIADALAGRRPRLIRQDDGDTG